ncbi:MAG TPA: acyl-CoA dehydrogenase family protein [Candidatus Elarobacter sp.]|jgi:alkylation response protein AidB-like acyl-CoA dehydrogenase|nr:acyl-CoA dehydrogenase family protein [Candidatus Elarobacter sp.]
MSDASYLSWPFFEDEHRALASSLDRWAAERFDDREHVHVDTACRELVGALGRDGWLRYAVPARFGGAFEEVDSRAVCLVRETLARHDALADFAFAMQGLGSAPIVLAGEPEVQAAYLPRVCAGDAIAAFALSETGAGSDVAAIATTARRDGESYVLDGEKTWISNGGIADLYVVFARTGEAPGSRGLSAFVVDAHTPGLEIAERIELIAPHPLATLRFRDCRVPASHRLGAGGEGFKLAMRSLDIFRASVAAAALGLARRALDEALERATTRTMFGQRLAEFQLTQAAIAEMASEIDASALLTYRAAWVRDVLREPATREAAMAKLAATEGAQRVIDRAVQLHGALGVTRGSITERLYREIRALRIYEGASEVQQLIIARQTLARYAEEEA